jgi:hypothetical protein
MNALCWPIVGVLLPLILVTGFPDTSGDVFVRHLIEDTVGCKDDEIVVLLDLELTNFWFSLHYIHVAAPVCELGLWITKGTRDTQATWKNSDWANDVFGFPRLLLCAAWLYLFLLGVSFDTLGSGCLINLASSLDDALVLLNVRWLMVPT